MTASGVSTTRESSTNTEAKTWSNTSTQTVVSRQVPRSSSLTRVQQLSREIDAQNHVSQSLTTNVPRPSSVEPKITVTTPAFNELHSEPNKTTTKDIQNEKNCVSQDILKDEHKLTSQSSKCETVGDTSLSSKIQGTSPGPSCSNGSAPDRLEVQHICKHNCQHCFYI